MIIKPSKSQFLIWFNHWVTVRRLMGINIEIRDYQPEKLWEIIQTGHKKFLLCAAPNAGKTLMSIIYLDWCFHCNPNFKAVILTHGTDDLREQYKGEMIYFKSDCLDNPNIIINLPRQVRNMNIEDIDLLIVDEAHHFYFAADSKGLIQQIIKTGNPKQELLLTATPSDFILYNKRNPNKQYHISFISVYDLWLLGFIQDVLIELASTTYDFKSSDYNVKGDLKEGKVISRDKIFAAMSELMEKIMERLRSRLKNKPTYHKGLKIVTDKALLLKSKLSVDKTMIVCRTTKEAGMVKEFLIKYGYSSDNILQSTSDVVGTKNLRAFVNNTDIKFVIVIYRGILGFNYPDLCNIIDLTGSRNVNRNFQLYCRLVRKSKTTTEKFYYKVVPTDLVYYFEKFMAGVLHLSHTHFLKMFNGNNFLDLPLIPVEPRKKKKRKKRPDIEDPTDEDPTDDGDRTIEGLGLEYVFELIPLWHKGDKVLDSKAYYTLNNAMGAFKKHKMSFEECLDRIKAAKEIIIKNTNKNDSTI